MVNLRSVIAQVHRSIGSRRNFCSSPPPGLSLSRSIGSRRNFLSSPCHTPPEGIFRRNFCTPVSLSLSLGRSRSYSGGKGPTATPTDQGGNGGATVTDQGGNGGAPPTDQGGNGGATVTDQGGNGAPPTDQGGNGAPPTDQGGNGAPPTDQGGNGATATDQGWFRKLLGWFRKVLGWFRKVLELLLLKFRDVLVETTVNFWISGGIATLGAVGLLTLPEKKKMEIESKDAQIKFLLDLNKFLLHQQVPPTLSRNEVKNINSKLTNE